MQLENRITALIGDSLQVAGYEIVRVRLIEGRKKTLQIMIDRLDEKDITIKDCEKASRLISAIIDVDDPVSGEYDLEVSSPGIDRPLVRLKDFERFKGLEAKISTIQPVEGRKRFKGKLVGVVENAVHVLLADPPLEVAITFDNILSAKLVLNDELMAYHQKQEDNR